MYSFRILQYCIGMLSSQLTVIYKGEGSSVTVESVVRATASSNVCTLC